VRVLVTGGRGFIGRAVSRALAAARHDVAALDNGWRSGVPAPPGVEPIDADVRDAAAVRAACEGADIVLHLAAIQGTENFYRVPDLVLDVNLRGVLNVAEACADAGVRRLIFSSSSEVYGEPTKFPTPETAPLVVPDPLNPRWSYGGSKIAGELVVINAARQRGFEFAVVRYHNVYGPGMGWDHVIPQFIRRLELGEAFTVQGDGSQRRAFCYVDDAVEATVAAATSGAAGNQILNIGNPGAERSINEVIESLALVSGKSIVPQYVPFEGGGTLRRVPDVERVTALLGWRPSVSFEEGLRRTYVWYAHALERERNAALG
jgi:nucleoside-diphosphate-sugar epimerase